MIRGFIPLPVYLAILAVIYWRVSSAFKPSKRKRILFLGTLLIVPIYFILLGMVISLNNIPVWIRINGFLMGFLLVATIPLGVEFILSLLWPAQRKVFISVALVITLVFTGWGLVNGLKVPVVKQIELQIPDWPKELSGLRVAFLADLHLGGAVSVKWLEDTVERINKENPDLIVIAGDLVGGLSNRIVRYRPALNKLHAPLGVWASRGNHEFDNGGRTFRKLIKGTNIQVLENRNMILENGLQLAGVDDPDGLNSPDRPGGADIQKALSSLDPSKPVLLISHRPHIFNKIPKNLQVVKLSGHTHAGQFPPMSWISCLRNRYDHGIYKRENSLLLVSPGTGTWEYLPLRILSNNCIIVLSIEA